MSLLPPDILSFLQKRKMERASTGQFLCVDMLQRLMQGNLDIPLHLYQWCNPLASSQRVLPVWRLRSGQGASGVWNTETWELNTALSWKSAIINTAVGRFMLANMAGVLPLTLFRSMLFQVSRMNQVPGSLLRFWVSSSFDKTNASPAPPKSVSLMQEQEVDYNSRVLPFTLCLILQQALENPLLYSQPFLWVFLRVSKIKFSRLL